MVFSFLSLGFSLNGKVIANLDLNKDNLTDLIIFNKLSSSDDISFYIFNLNTVTFDFNQTILASDIDLPDPLTGALFREYIFDFSGVKYLSLYVCVSNSANEANYIAKLDFDSSLVMTQANDGTQLPLNRVISAIDIIGSNIYIGAVNPTYNFAVNSSIFSINKELASDSFTMFENATKGAILDLSSFNSPIGEVVVAGISMSYYYEDDNILYYVFDTSTDNWYKTTFSLDSEQDSFSNEIYDFRIRSIVKSQEEYLESVLIASSQGLWKTYIKTDVISISPTPVFYAVDTFRVWDLFAYEQTGTTSLIPFTKFPVINIINLYEFDKYLDLGYYAYDKLKEIDPSAYDISADKKHLICIKGAEFDWRAKAPDDSDLYYEVRYFYKADIAYASGLLSASYRIDEYDHVGNIAAENTQMRADKLGFQLQNPHDLDHWTFYYGTDYQDWNYQQIDVTTGVPYVLSPGSFADSGISTSDVFLGLTEYGNNRMNYGTIATTSDSVSTSAELSQFETGQDFNDPDNYQYNHSNPYIDSVWVEDLDFSSSINFSSDMADYTDLLGDMGNIAADILPDTVVNTVAYQPEIIDVVVGDSAGGSPTVEYDGVNEIETLRSKDGLLSVYENIDNINRDMYIDVTFQLDHNEDYESIQYILLSTAFAHEIDANTGSPTQVSFGEGENEFKFILLDDMLNEDDNYYFRTLPYGEKSFDATNFLLSDWNDIYRKRKTMNFGESIYSDVILDGGVEYYKPDNDASKANFLYDPSLGSHWNRIDDGIFTKTDDNRFEFHYYYHDAERIGEKEDNYWEEHIYDYNYLRLDTNTLTDFVGDENLTIRIFLSGYAGDINKLDGNKFFIRHFNCTVFSNKDNLNAQNWDFSGDGYTSQDTDGSLILNSGSISLDDNNCPDKAYIDSNSDTKYRAVFRLQDTGDIVTFSVGSASYEYNPLHPNTLSLQDGINTIEITYDTVNSWNFFVNGENGTDGTGELEGWFNPNEFEPSGDFYPAISVGDGDEINLIEIKNQVFEKIDANYNGWSIDYNDSEELIDVGGVGEANNDLTYSDISLQREIIYTFNNGLSDLDAVFEDLRLWSDVDYYTNINDVSQGQYNTSFPLFKMDDHSYPNDYRSDPTNVNFPIEVPFYPGGLDVPFTDFVPEISLPPNIYILKIEPRFYFQYGLDSNVKFSYKFTTGMAQQILDDPLYGADGYYHQSWYDYDNDLSDLPFYIGNDLQEIPFGSAFTYTDNLDFTTALLHIDCPLDLRISYFYYKIYTTDKPNTFEDSLYNQGFDIPFDDLTEFYILGKNNEKRLISDSANFSSDESSIKSLLQEANNPIGEFTLTEYEIDLNGLIGDSDFIDINNFKLEVIDRANYNQITPLFEVNSSGSFNHATNLIEDCWISYYAYYRVDHPNKFMLIVNWTSDKEQLIPYDTNLLLTYKVMQGRKITSVTFEDTEDVVVPVDFRMFDYGTFEWVGTNWIDREVISLPSTENSSLFTDVVQDQTIIVENSSIGSGIIGLVDVWSKTGADSYEILNTAYYNYSIATENGIDALKVTYTDSTTIDLKVEYAYIPLVKLTHYAVDSSLDDSLIKVMVNNSLSTTSMTHDIDYNITGTNLNNLIFYTLYSSITPDYSVDDAFFISYNAHLTEEINPVSNMILEFLDSDGLWKPIAKVPVDINGEFDQRLYMGKGGLQFPINEETIMRLTYLPSNLTTYNNEYLEVDYSGFNCVYNTSYPIYELFTLTVKGKESKIEYIPTEFSTAFDQWATISEREYSTTTNPYETLHAGEPYTYFDFHRTVTDEYEFTFQLTDEFGNFLKDQVLFMEIGWKPKAGLNYKVIDWEDENGEYIDSEALGTAWFTDQGQEVCLGPGVMDYDYSVSRMYTRPETWEYLDPETGQVGEYSSYYWDYRITDDTGSVSFSMSLDGDYIGDHHRIFDESLFSSGSVTFDSLDDYRLYVRVFHAPIYDIGNMAFEDASQLYCSQGNDVFDMNRISEFDEFDYSGSTFYSGAYGEGPLTLHPEDIMLGVPNLLIYQLGSKLNDTFSFTVEVAEADVIPDAELMTLGKLEQSFESNNLVLEYENNTYLIDGMPIIATITDYYGNSVFKEGNVQFSSYIDSSGLATFNISDHYLLQLDPGVYQVSIFTIPRAYTKDAYRFITLECRPENWLKFGEPTMTLDLLNWFDSGWGEAHFGNDYAFYEDIYPRLTGYLATLHSEEGIGDYVDFSLYAKARNISSTTDWGEIEWIELGDEDIYLSSLVYDGLYYFEYPLGQDGDMLMNKEVILNISANAFYNQTGMIEEGRKQELYILNLTLVNSTIRNDSLTLRSYLDTDSKDMWIGQASVDPYGVERYFEYTTDIDTYGIDSDDVLLTLNGYNDIIEIVEVRGQWEYNETILEESTDYTVSIDNDYTIIIDSQTNLDNYSDLIISYAIQLSEDKVMNFTFSESDGFEFSEIILDTQNNPIELDHDKYLGVFYSKFNESYGLVSNAADLNIGFSGIEITDVKIFNVTNTQGQQIDDTYMLSKNGDQIKITFDTTTEDVFIEYGIAAYSLDRGYQRIGMNFTDSVRKLSKFHDSHKIYNYSSSADVNLLTIPDDPLDPLEAGQPKILVPLLEDNKTSISFNYLALLFDSVLNGSFYLDDCVLSGGVQDLKPILATFTFTTEDGESYFDFVTIDPTTGENRFDFEINLQPMYAVHGYTTYDLEIDFLSYGDNPSALQYVLFDKFELTTDDRILQIVDKPMLTKKGDIDESQVINTAHYTQIFTDRLNEAYDVIDDALVTIAVEGFDDYGELVKLYRDENNDDQLTFEPIEDNEFCFQNLPSHDYRLVDSLGLHIDAYDLDLPEYIEGEVNLYAGNGTYPYGEVYEDLGISMNWFDSTGYSDYTVDVDAFNAHDYNSDNFLISTLPLTGDYMYVEGELYLHHRIDLTTAELITSGLPANVEFAIVLPNTTSRIDSLSVKNIDSICHPWDWVESWQGFALTEDDYNLYNPDLAETYNPSSTVLDEGFHYDLVINDEGRDQLNFYFEDQEIINELLSDIIQIDFHIDYEFTDSDYAIEEDTNTYNSEIHWQLPNDSYLYWDQFEYHPDLTSTTTFNASFFHLSDYAPMDDYESSTIETFQFYPNEYNFTTFEFTGFTDNTFEVLLNLTYGGEFDDIIDTQDWDRIKPFGITIQTESGERYINDEFMYGWQHSPELEHEDKPIYKFSLLRGIYEYIGLLNDTEILVTYYYQKESLSYYTQHDDILYGGDYTFIIKDSEDVVIDTLGNILSIEGNNITFTENILLEELLYIGENFTVEYSFKTRGGLLDTKHFFVEVQPWDMKFYNSYYPFSGGSIIAPLYYNLSANYQYQLALNYRLQEKSILTISHVLDDTDVQSNIAEVDLENNHPITDVDNSPALVAYFVNSTQQKEEIEEEYIDYNIVDNKVTISDISIFSEGELEIGKTIYISIMPEYHNKYQPFHDLIVDLSNEEIILTNWTVAQDPANNLIANYESTNFVYDVDPYESISMGKVKQVYAILNSTNNLTYYLTEDLNDPVDGWKDYDTLIMKIGLLNPDVLMYINVSFFYDDLGQETYIGYSNVTIDMFDDETGAVYITLPDSSDFDKFTIENNARVVFTPVFYQHTDFLGYFYEQGFPTYQTVEWDSDNVIENNLPVDLEREMYSLDQKVLVFNDQFELIYELDVDTRTQQENYNGETYTLEFNNISLPSIYIVDGKTFVMEDGDILFLKYNATLEESIGITIEEMVLQKRPFIKNYDTGLNDVPIAEISLLGINNDGITYATDDLFENRDKLVAWETPLDITPFENEFYNTYRQLVINVSLEDIYTDFKVLDSENVENSYITDILITTNDPRYQLTIDSIFLFEFDENATLYDSEIFDIFPNNHMETFYVGNYSDIYSESIILDASSFLPLYSDDDSIDETLYFDVFDNVGNWYYFGSHLLNESLGTGIYNITWNPQYSDEYYYAYINQYEDLADLYDYYNPHIDTFRYLYISWADEDAWNEWQTIEQVNINSSTLDITFEWYNETLEEYESIIYNQTLNEFEARHIAVEPIYPYDSSSTSDIFDLSQDYSNAQDLDIYKITGYFFNETEKVFDISLSNIQEDKKSINITAPSGFNLDNFEKIIVYLNFTEGAYSDYTQFRLLQAAINNYPEVPLWTKNDSIYVDFEYNDIDYFLLVEDYAVGSEDSLFEEFNYMRNDYFVKYNYENEFYFVEKISQFQDFDNFTRVDDKRSVLELHDFDLDSEHEVVIQKEDVTVDGTYDVFKYGEIDPAGEIVFHTTLIKVDTIDVETQKTADVRVSKPYSGVGGIIAGVAGYARRTIITETTITHRTHKISVIVQEDLDNDGVIDKEVTFDTTDTLTTAMTYTTEITDFRINSNGFDREPLSGNEGALIEYRNATFSTSDKSHSFTFRDFVNGEINSTRLYQDTFPNEITEVYNLDNYRHTITNDNGDDDPANDVIIEAPRLQSLLSLTHTTDNIPAIFDSKMTIESSGIETLNILAIAKPVSISDSRTDLDMVASTLDVIQVIPKKGVVYDSNPRYSPKNILGEYWYYDSSQNGVYDTIFVVNENHEVIAVGFDYDYNKYLQPSKRIFVEKHIIRDTSLGFEAIEQVDIDLIARSSLIYIRDYDSYDGFTLDTTFSDSLYDLWKIQYSSSSSQLIKEVMSITSRQFIKSVRSRIVGDIAWQVVSQLIGVATGAIFSALFAPLGPLGSLLGGQLGFMLGYGIANAIKAQREAKKNARMIASQTFYNEDFEGEVTLSDKKAHDKLWGGTLPDVSWWSTSGTYAQIQVETDKHLFKGEIVLAKKGVKKTKNFGLTNVPISMDYELQTRSYLMYSDFGSEHFNEYFFTSVLDYIQSDFLLIPKDASFSYMANSLMYLENAISQETDDEFNTIYPYMIYGQGTFVPTFQFAGFDTNHPVPEFFHEYPIYVEEKYMSVLEDEYHTIYKVYDEDSSQDIELIPEDSTHSIYGKVDHIDIYYLNSEGFSYQLINSPYYLDEGDYAFDNVTGILTLSDSMYASLHSTLDILENIYSDIQDYEGYYMFEVKIEKYRAIDPDNPIDNHIATMQAIEQSILEYTFQFKHAQKTQQGLSEMFYTFFVTSISTIFTTGITLGMGFAAKGMSPSSKMGIGLKNYLTNFASIKSWQFLKLALSPLTETFQEIFVDPYLETIVTDLVAKLGGDVFLQVLASSLAEGAREGLTGPLSQFLSQRQESALSQLQDQHLTEGVQNTDQAKIDENSQKSQDHKSSKVKWGSIIKSGASLALGAALIGIGGPMFFGASLVMGYSAISSFKSSFKTYKTIIHNVISEQLPSDYYESGVIADSINALNNEVLDDLVEGAQVSNLRREMLTNPRPEMIRMTRSLVGDQAARLGIPQGLVGDLLGGFWLDEPELIRRREKLIHDYQGILVQVFMDLYNALSRNGFTWQKLDALKSKIEAGHQGSIGPKFLSKLAGKVAQHFIDLFDPLLEARPSTSKYGWDRGAIDIQITAISMRKDAAFKAIEECVDFINFWNRKQPQEFTAFQRPLNERTVLIENIRNLFPTKHNIPISNLHLKEILFPGTSKTSLSMFMRGAPRMKFSSLLALDFNVQRLELSQLKRIGLTETTSDQLNDIKRDVKQLIWQFFYKESNQRFIGRRDYRMGYEYCYKKYNLIRNLIFATSDMFNNGDFLTMKETAAKLRTGSLNYFLHETTPHSDILKRWSDIFEAQDSSFKRKDLILQSIWDFRNLSPVALRSRVGTEAHPIWEYYTQTLSKSIDLSIMTEKETPEGKRPDHIILRDKKFSQIESKDIFKDLFSGYDLRGVLQFLVDYTLSVDERTILGKCKKYHAEDRFLLIVLYGPLYDSGIISDLMKLIKKEGYDKAKIITLEEYFDLLGIDDEIIKKTNRRLGNIDDVQDIINQILTGPLSLNEREALLDKLGTLYEKSRSLLKFGTTMDNFLDSN